MRNAFPILSLLTLIFCFCVIFSLLIGSVNISLNELWAIMMGRDHGYKYSLIMELRLPRALGAFVTGGMLSLAGALMQVLLRNPLAEPYVLGVSGGAAVAALISMMAGLSTGWLLQNAFLGALFSIILVFGLAHKNGAWTTSRLLLTGVVIASGWGAVISLLLSLAPESNLPGMLFWLMGDLSQAQNTTPYIIILIAGLALCMPMARDLNILSYGEQQASALGVSIKAVRIGIYFIASILTAAAVTLAGSIGFVGLVVPHIIRLVFGNDYRMLLPASVLLGGSLLLVADTFARSIVAPQQLPVGVITALLGVPTFLYLLQRQNTGKSF